MFLDHVRPGLEEHQISIVSWNDLTDYDKLRLSNYFSEQVFPVLTPLAVDPAHPFPYISGLSLNLAVTVRDPEGGGERFARVKVPDNVPRLVRVEADRGSSSATFLPLEELIAAHLGELFTGMEVIEFHAFRVTRNADLEVEEDRDEDLLQALERELARRRFGPPVRLEVADDMTEHMLELLLRELEVDPHDVVQVPGLLDLSCLWQLYGVDRKQLKDPAFVPATHPAFGERETPKSVFATLREGDVLVHHPYDSFSTSVQRFIEQAAADPQVLAIKQTLYRTSGDSPIVDALIDAAEAGKQVVALVEIKARFDEQANIKWARTLEKAGVHVVYGLVGPEDALQDLAGGAPGGLDDPPLLPHRHRQLQPEDRAAVRGHRPAHRRADDRRGPHRPVQRADRVRAAGRPTAASSLPRTGSGAASSSGSSARSSTRGRAARAGVRIKVNSLVDEQVIDALYRASQAGVPVDVVVRGICALKPGIPGLSREHPGAVDPRPVPRALAGVPLRRLRRALDRQRRPDAPQPRPPGRGAGPGHRPEADRAAGRHVRLRAGPATRCWVLRADGEWEASPSDGTLVRDHQMRTAAQARSAGLGVSRSRPLAPCCGGRRW